MRSTLAIKSRWSKLLRELDNKASSKLIISAYFVKINLEYSSYTITRMLVYVRKHRMRQMQLHRAQDEGTSRRKGDFESV
jgi:hypothetical protein